MNSSDHDRPSLSRADEDLVRRLGEVYRPSPMTTARRVAFEQALRARIERPPRRRWLVAWTPAAAAAAAAGLWLVLGGPADDPETTPHTSTAALSRDAWEEELFASAGSERGSDPEWSDAMPEEYTAIASAFLDF